MQVQAQGLAVCGPRGVMRYIDSMQSLLRRGLARVRRRRPPQIVPITHFGQYSSRVAGKAGIEIGGPSAAFRVGNVLPIYPLVGALDNCDFSSDTVWAAHGSEFVYDPAKAPGKSFFCEGSNLVPITDASYDFLLSSHNLEHFANPVKALVEWKRVLRGDGTLVLILPHYKDTFDHRRRPTPVANMMDDYERGIGEDDLSHLEEILAQHDLERDPGAGTAEEFRRRSLENVKNRCLHHHVFDEHNSRELLTRVGFEVLAVEVASDPIHLCLLARLPAQRSA